MEIPGLGGDRLQTSHITPPSPAKLDVKISRSRGQGISCSVLVLALSLFIPALIGPHSAPDGSTGMYGRGLETLRPSTQGQNLVIYSGHSRNHLGLDLS